MPIYEYQCAQCGHEFDALQKVSDEPLRVCTACGQETLNKMVSATNFQLKGGGWYKAAPTDNSGSAGSDAKSADAQLATASEQGAEKNAGIETKTGSSKGEGSANTVSKRPASESVSSKAGSGAETKTPSTATSKKDD